MKRIYLEDVLKFEEQDLCCYTEKELKALDPENKGMTARDVAKLDIEPTDIYYALMYYFDLSDKELRLHACWCARRALGLVENPDPRSIKAVEVVEAYANGKATKEELEKADDAAASAADTAADDAAASAASAAYAAAAAAADDAAASAAYYASDAFRAFRHQERLAQIKDLLERIETNEDHA